MIGDGPQPGETPGVEGDPWSFADPDPSWWRGETDRSATDPATGRPRHPRRRAPQHRAAAGSTGTLLPPDAQVHRTGETAAAHAAAGRDVAESLTRPDRAVTQRTASDPVANQPAVSEPVDGRPAVSEPVEARPTTSEPVEARPTTSEPTTTEADLPSADMPAADLAAADLAAADQAEVDSAGAGPAGAEAAEANSAEADSAKAIRAETDLAEVNPATGAALEPSNAKPAASPNAASRLRISEPVAPEHNASAPVAPEPVASSPAVIERGISESATSGPTTSGPTTSGPTTSRPTTSRPTTSGPTTSEHVDAATPGETASVAEPPVVERDHDRPDPHRYDPLRPPAGYTSKLARPKSARPKPATAEPATPDVEKPVTEPDVMVLPEPNDRNRPTVALEPGAAPGNRASTVEVPPSVPLTIEPPAIAPAAFHPQPVKPKAVPGRPAHTKADQQKTDQPKTDQQKGGQQNSGQPEPGQKQTTAPSTDRQVTPPQTAPQQTRQPTAPQQTTAQQATPQQATAQQATPQQATAQQATPQQAGPLQAGPQGIHAQTVRPRQDHSGMRHTEPLPPLPPATGSPVTDARLEKLENSPFWQDGHEQALLAPGPGRTAPIAPRTHRAPRKRIARRPVSVHLTMIMLGLVAAFFGWVSAEPFWLSAGHGDLGYATVGECSGEGLGQHCAGQFSEGGGRYTIRQVTLLGVDDSARATGTIAPARMVSPDSRQAYLGDTGWLLQLRWLLGFSLVLICGYGIAGVTGARRLPQARARRAAILVSLAGPLALLAGFLIAAY